MKVKTRIAAVLVLAIAAVALLVPAARAGPGTPGIDANDRAHFGKPLATTAMQDAHQRVGITAERATLIPDGRTLRARIAQLDAHSRASAGLSAISLSSYLDAADRTNAGRGIVPVSTGPEPDGTGFAWADAGIGAAAALLIVGALGLAVLAMRHGRGRVAVP